MVEKALYAWSKPEVKPEQIYPSLKKYPNLAKYKEILHTCGTCRQCYTYYKFPPKYHETCPSFYKFGFYSYTSGGRNIIARRLLEGKMKMDKLLLKNLYACTTCAACSENCTLDYSDYTYKIIEALRADAVAAGIGPLPSQRAWSERGLSEHNPYLESHTKRTEWIPSAIKRRLPKKADYIYFVGCTSSYREKNIAKATMEILMELGLDFTVLEDEWCCGSPYLRTGQWNPVREMAQHNVDIINKTGASKVITTCAGCYRTWKKDYADTYKDLINVDFDFKPIHTVELLAKFIKNDEIEFEGKFEKNVTYHDPCHLGRHVGVYDTPREVLKAIPGLRFIEMPRNREAAWCCGAGGGFKSGFGKEAVEISRIRVDEAKETGAEILTSACPFCYRNFRDTIITSNVNIEVYDIVEIVRKLMKSKIKS